VALDIGQIAPDFTLPANNGETIQLSNLRGQNIVLYFYPKDDTPGCTNEAKDFTAAQKEFADANTIIIGASKDTVAKHDKFIAKHDLKVSLVSDEAGEVVENYGVWVEKNMYGRKYMGIERATFLIDAAGTIQAIWRKVKVKGHVEAVLTATKDLK